MSIQLRKCTGLKWFEHYGMPFRGDMNKHKEWSFQAKRSGAGDDGECQYCHFNEHFTFGYGSVRKIQVISMCGTGFSEHFANVEYQLFGHASAHALHYRCNMEIHNTFNGTLCVRIGCEFGSRYPCTLINLSNEWRNCANHGMRACTYLWMNMVFI